jgi:alpha-ketoglutarate-dependent taurine dioxygenase
VDWYERQSESFRSELDEMILIHKFTPGKINPGLRKEQDFLMYKNMCPVDNVRMPMIIQSPGGFKGLHYSINTVHQIDGMSYNDSQKLFDRINKELFTDEFIYDHWYQNNNDLCLFDNSITLHRRLGGISNRLAYRIQYDYTNLQDGPYVPYFQSEFKKKYVAEIRDYARVMGDTEFKIPKRRWTDLLPSFS